jgi:hypothetical protein
MKNLSIKRGVGVLATKVSQGQERKKGKRESRDSEGPERGGKHPSMVTARGIEYLVDITDYYTKDTSPPITITTTVSLAFH